MADPYKKVCRHLQSKGADIAIILCTELSAINSELPIKIIGADQILSKRIIDITKGIKKDAF